MKKTNNKVNKTTVIISSIVLCGLLLIMISFQFKTEPSVDKQLPQNSEEEQMTDEPKPQPIPIITEPVIPSSEINSSHQSETPPPPKVEDEAMLKNPTKKPTYRDEDLNVS